MCLQVCNILSSSDRDMAQNVILQRSYVKMNSTIGLLDLTNIDLDIVILRALVKKFMVIDVILQNNGIT